MRYPEIDFFRGTAVILMLVFHSFFDAYYFGKIELSGSFWYYFPRFIGGMFIFISGYTLSAVRPDLKRVMRKVCRLSALAATITLITYILLPDEVVVFGVIHFFAVATLMGFFLLNYPKLQLPLGIILFLSGIIVGQFRLNTPLLLWLGLMPHGFTTLDYYPLLPWLGVFLLGMFAANHLKPGRIDLNVWPVNMLGKHSLLVYILQHPIIVLLLHLYFGDVLQHFGIVERVF